MGRRVGVYAVFANAYHDFPVYHMSIHEGGGGVWVGGMFHVCFFKHKHHNYMFCRGYDAPHPHPVKRKKVKGLAYEGNSHYDMHCSYITMYV